MCVRGRRPCTGLWLQRAETWTVGLLVKDVITPGLIALVAACGYAAGPTYASGLHVVVNAGVERPEVRIYEDEAFYRQRDEPEESFTGRIERKDVVQGPGTRRHAYRLVTGDTEIPIYATSTADERLRPLIGHHVRTRGKLIDLRGEGFGVELWIGTIAPAIR